MISTSITPQMIEMAARAIRERVAGRSVFTQGFRKPRPWSALPLTLRDDYRAEARAALTAGLSAQQDAYARDDRVGAYREMIAQALGDE